MSWQHAAQERVFYERLQHGQVCSHQLIPSQVVTLLAADWVCVDEHLASLSACGFIIHWPTDHCSAYSPGVCLLKHEGQCSFFPVSSCACAAEKKTVNKLWHV